MTLGVKCLINGNKDPDYLETQVNCIIENSQIYTTGMGDLSYYAYGIMIDTSQDTFCYEQQIPEEIQANEVLLIPICFFPDKSCKMNFEVELGYIKNGKQKYIKLDAKELQFRISSIYSPNQSLENWQNSNGNIGIVLYSYPYTDAICLKEE